MSVKNSSLWNFTVGGNDFRDLISHEFAIGNLPIVGDWVVLVFSAGVPDRGLLC